MKSEVEMPRNRKTQGMPVVTEAHFKVGWALLVMALLAIAVPVLATAAQPHVVWLFSMSYGAVGLVVGGTLIRVGHQARDGDDRCDSQLEGCRS